MLDGLQQFGPQHTATRIGRQVDFGRARVHVGQLERDRVLESATRQRGEGGGPLEHVQPRLFADACLGRLVEDQLAQVARHLRANGREACGRLRREAGVGHPKAAEQVGGAQPRVAAQQEAHLGRAERA
eukprot:scaffold76252_cov57-Phaeocystis_antarctica.AAC.3